MTNQNPHLKKHLQGFSLLELSIVLVIGATIAVSLLTLGNVQHERAKVERTVMRMDAIETAIMAYATREGRLPCPARYNSAPNSATYGVSVDCTALLPPLSTGMIASGVGNEAVWRGTVPVRSLNLDDRYMIDGWQNRLSYAVIREVSEHNPVNYITAATNGVITIEDKNGNQLTNSDTIQVDTTDADTVVGYVLISHGRDGAGSYSKVVTPADTTPTTACAVGTLDNENCDADSVFIDTRINDSSTASSFFFDIVRWKPIYFLQEFKVAP